MFKVYYKRDRYSYWKLAGVFEHEEDAYAEARYLEVKDGVREWYVTAK
jgi:hypothetical protein